MVVRIQGAGQYRLDEAAEQELDRLDHGIVEAVERRDLEAAHALLSEAGRLVRERGQELDDAHLAPSDLILPDADASLDEIQSLIHVA